MKLTDEEIEGLIEIAMKDGDPVTIGFLTELKDLRKFMDECKDIIPEAIKHIEGGIMGAFYMVKQLDGSTQREFVEFENGKFVKRARTFIASDTWKRVMG